MTREIINPRWGNEEKTHIIAGFRYDDGRVLTASITNVGDAAENPDWKEIMESFGEEALDKNTKDSLDRHRQRKAKQMEDKSVEMERRKKEELFNAKAEAFEIDLVKNSKNRAVKNKIRRASSITEVLVYTALLHMLEDPLAAPSSETENSSVA
ncbi:hypothetical protein UFOVP247_109 [uncultured Caudovirales phage]|uniref:Uncharacterized protein n=1 Tax=uncultured Caudovirales phage TaxID=2100421 RepID=A0A6J7WX14_9CAUD|nr:hypothetical protein UFOVP247_109 [uncultured Caudovirales phage]